MKEKCINFFRYFFPVFFVIYFGNITFFTHAHIINGVTIVHSHPYKNDNTGHPAHQHTPTQFQLIHQVSTFGCDVIGSTYTLPGAFLLILAVLFIRFTDSGVKGSYERVLSLRAPPVFSHLK